VSWAHRGEQCFTDVQTVMVHRLVAMPATFVELLWAHRDRAGGVGTSGHPTVSRAGGAYQQRSGTSLVPVGVGCVCRSLQAPVLSLVRWCSSRSMTSVGLIMTAFHHHSPPRRQRLSAARLEVVGPDRGSLTAPRGVASGLQSCWLLDTEMEL
jgi:hypothetical protein